MVAKDANYTSTIDSEDEREPESFHPSKSTGDCGKTRTQSSTVVLQKRNYTLKEAALYLNVSTRTVERLIERRLLRRNKTLRKILIPRSELDAFSEKNL